MISTKTIEEFRIAVGEEYGCTITSREAEQALGGLVRYFDTLMRIKHGENVEVPNPALVEDQD